MTTRLAIIPARGGSKRLPRKNLLPLNGKPILAHPIGACLDSGLFDRVIVSTEDPEIADAARRAGAEVLDREAELASDESTVADVCADVLDRLSGDGFAADVFCVVYATAAFLTAEDLEKSLPLLERPPGANIVLGVSEYNLQPQQALRGSDGYLVPMWPELIRRKSQYLPRFVASNGTFCWVQTVKFIEEGNFPLERMRGYEISRLRAVDIDTAEDYAIALAITEMKVGSK